MDHAGIPFGYYIRRVPPSLLLEDELNRPRGSVPEAARREEQVAELLRLVAQDLNIDLDGCGFAPLVDAHVKAVYRLVIYEFEGACQLRDSFLRHGLDVPAQAPPATESEPDPPPPPPLHEPVRFGFAMGARFEIVESPQGEFSFLAADGQVAGLVEDQFVRSSAERRRSGHFTDWTSRTLRLAFRSPRGEEPSGFAIVEDGTSTRLRLVYERSPWMEVLIEAGSRPFGSGG